MAGIVPLSLQQVFDPTGGLLAGGRLQTFEAGTTTPQNVYQDGALTIPHPNPVIADAAGRMPLMWAADGNIKLRLTSSEGVVQLAEDNVLVFGPSSGEGGGGAVDADALISTGDIKCRYSTGVLAGYVRLNGRTIGSATSSATERANADTEALFLHLWNEDANLAVSTGRGANAAADFAANKNIALPDWRGRLIAGLDDMGTSAAGRLTSTYFGTAATTLGAAGGTQSKLLTQTDIPDYDVTADASTVTWTTIAAQTLGVSTAPPASQPVVNAVFDGSVTGGGVTQYSSKPGTHSGSIVVSVNGGISQTAHSVVPPTMLCTFYIRL
jgi:hypothetical protein